MIALRRIERSWPSAIDGGRGLSGVDLDIDRGDFLIVTGPSGSGKSCLLHIIGLLDRPSSGSYRLEDRETTLLDEGDLARLRSRRFGFVFRDGRLFPELSVEENVLLPMRYANMPRHLRKRRVGELLSRVGLGGKEALSPAALTREERQRAAIARALANDPICIVADEPFGDLRSHEAASVFRLLEELNGEGLAIVLATTDKTRFGMDAELEEVLRVEARYLRLRDGRIDSAPVPAPRLHV